MVTAQFCQGFQLGTNYLDQTFHILSELSLEKQQTLLYLLGHKSPAKCVFQRILQAHHPNSLDNIVHTAAERATKPSKKSSVFGTKNLLSILGYGKHTPHNHLLTSSNRRLKSAFEYS